MKVSEKGAVSIASDQRGRHAIDSDGCFGGLKLTEKTLVIDIHQGPTSDIGLRRCEPTLGA